MYMMVSIKSGEHDYRLTLVKEPRENRMKEVVFFKTGCYKLVATDSIPPAERLTLETRAVAAVIAEGWRTTRNRIVVDLDGFQRGALFGPRGGCTARNAYCVCALILPMDGAQLTMRDADTSKRWVQYVLE